MSCKKANIYIKQYSIINLNFRNQMQSKCNFFSIIQNAPDNVQFLHVIHRNIYFCPLVNIDATSPSYIQLLFIWYARWQHQTCTLYIHSLKCITMLTCIETIKQKIILCKVCHKTTQSTHKEDLFGWKWKLWNYRNLVCLQNSKYRTFNFFTYSTPVVKLRR